MKNMVNFQKSKEKNTYLIYKPKEKVFMNLKLDIKSILILVLLGFSIVFFALWYFKGDDTKSRIKELENINKNIEIQRDSLKNVNKVLKVDFDNRQKDIEERDNQIKSIELELSKTKKDLVVANGKVKEKEKELADTKKKIEELKKNPIKRDDDDLIKSLKDKLK